MDVLIRVDRRTGRTVLFECSAETFEEERILSTLVKAIVYPGYRMQVLKNGEVQIEFSLRGEAHE